MPDGIAWGPGHWAVAAGYGLILAATVGRFLLCRAVIRRTTFLTPGSPAWCGPQAPKVSIIVPAKDEAANIENCLNSLLAQDYPDYEVLVVDDRSEDDTAAIAERVAARNPRVRVIRVRALPEGWTGKTHALHVAERSARGEWLLFIDADAALHPSCLSVTLRDAADHDAGLASLLPRMEMRSFWEQVVQPLAATLLMVLFPLPRVNDRSRIDFGFANGQFLLMRRSAYDAIGGHAAVRDKFCEDINLGRLVKRHGLGLRVTVAPDLASVRMYSSLPQIVRGWSRIFYAAADGRPLIPAGFAVVLFVLSGLPYVLLPVCFAMAAAGLAGSLTWLLAAFAAMHELLQTIVYIRAYSAGRTPLWMLIWRPISTFAMLAILMRTVRMCRTHEVTWRGTQYVAFSQAESAPARKAA
jgi:glycosyltransferase involved in cell wall biosynthesis